MQVRIESKRTVKEEMDGKVMIFTAPSGAGKTTLVRHLLANFDRLMFSISATTRPKRSYEKDGFDYYFLSKEKFRSHVAENGFLEWEEVYDGNYYGTLKSEIHRIWKLEKAVIFDVDVKGAISLKNYFGDRALAVFVNPPSVDVLIQRLVDRKTETESSLKRRIERFKMELSCANDFDVVLQNDDLDEAKASAEKIAADWLLAKA